MHRSANRSAKNIGQSVRDIRAHRVVTGILGERVARLLRVTMPVKVSRPVEAVGARFRLHHCDARNSGAELGIVVLVDEFQFLNRVERRIDYDFTDKPIFIIGPIKDKTRGKGRLTIRGNGDRTLRILSIGIGKRGSRCGRCQQYKGGGISY